MTITTHLILVSAQPVPNITPVLDERFTPQRIIMLVTPGMEARSQALERIYKPRGIKVERHPIADAWDIAHVSRQVEDIVMRHLEQHADERIILNVTGGTKLMSIAAFEVFRQLDLPIFYVHPEQDRLVWLHPEKSATDLADRIKIKAYLQAYGAANVILQQQFGVTPAIRDLTSQLIEDIERHATALGKLNFLAYQAERTGLQTDIDCGYRDNPALYDLLDLFSAADLCSLNGQQLIFPDEQARFIVNGGWLEMHTYAQCLDLKNKIALQDVAYNIEIVRDNDGKPIPNELDVGVLKNNRLYLIECKAKRFNDRQKNLGESADVLYKLNTLREVCGGQQAKAMLVSFNKIGKPHRDRARDLGINLCCYKDLQQLKTKLSEWLR